MSLPEKRHPHVVWVRQFSKLGTCTSPSCHILLWQCLSSPVIQNTIAHKQRNTWIKKHHMWDYYNHIMFKVRHVHTKTHLFVDVSISVDIIEVKGPLEFLSDGAPQQDGQSCYKILMRIKWWCNNLKLNAKQNKNIFFGDESSKPQTLWSLNVLCQMH